MLNRTVGQRRAAFMRTVRRADYDAAKGDARSEYEAQCNARRSKVTILEVDVGSSAKVKLPVIIMNGLR